MNKSVDDTIREDILSAYIDSLNDEKKPIDLNDDDFDDEMQMLFETVRAVKRLKDADTAEITANAGKMNRRNKFNKAIKVAAASAAVLMIFVSTVAIKGLISNSTKKSTASLNSSADKAMSKSQDAAEGAATAPAADKEKSTASGSTAGGSENKNTLNESAALEDKAAGTASITPQTDVQKKAVSPVLPSNGQDKMPNVTFNSGDTSLKSAAPYSIAAAKDDDIVYKMQNAYEQVSSYSGVIDIKTTKDGKLVSDQDVKITYKKPDQFVTVKIAGGITTSEYSDGEKLYTVEGSRVTVDYVYPVKSFYEYHIGRQIDELFNTVEFNEVGKETVSGKETKVYEYKFANDQKYNRVWVDTSTFMPIKREINSAGGTVTYQFGELKLNSEEEGNSFSYSVKINDDVLYLNEKATLGEIETSAVQIHNVIERVPEYLKLQKTIKLKNNPYNYYLSFQDETRNSFVDVYVSNRTVTNYYTPGDIHGILKDGWTEAESGAVNAFNVYIGETNTLKWISKDYEIVLVSNSDSTQLQKIFEDAEGTGIRNITDEELQGMGIKPKQ